MEKKDGQEPEKKIEEKKKTIPNKRSKVFLLKKKEIGKADKKSSLFRKKERIIIKEKHKRQAGREKSETIKKLEKGSDPMETAKRTSVFCTGRGMLSAFIFRSSHVWDYSSI